MTTFPSSTTTSLNTSLKNLAQRKDKAELQRYKVSFTEYAKRRVFECPPEFGPVSDADHADIFVKVDSKYDKYTVGEIEEFRHKLSEILGVSSQGISRLCRVDKGCFQLMFQVPSFVQHEIFPLSRKQEKALAAMGVIRLTCEKYLFKVKVSNSTLLTVYCIGCGMRYGGCYFIRNICTLVLTSDILLFPYRKMNHHKLELVCPVSYY